MSTPALTPTGTAFALRSAKLTTVALLLETADPGALAAALEAQASGTAPLFENDPVIVNALMDSPSLASTVSGCGNV